MEEIEKLEKACDFKKMLNVVENLNLRLRSVLYKTEDLQTILEEYNLQLWPGTDDNQE